MSIQFSDSTNKSGIKERTLKLLGVDSVQWPVENIVNSANDWHDFIVGYALANDKNFQWDDTNHTKLPEGTVNLTSGQSDYSFLTDEQGNSIVTLLGVSVYDGTYYQPLKLIDRNDADYDVATFGMISGTPTYYDKIADNIIRLDRKPSSTVTNGLKFYFQRTGSYFQTTDTTKTPGFNPLLHRGYVIASAYDGAITLGTSNVQLLANERQNEEKKVIQYFAERNNDNPKPKISIKRILYI